MPIYEYYCRPCHTIFSFFARSASSSNQPVCPKCQHKPLEKQVSRFAISKGLSEPSSGGDDPFAHLDDAQMEKLMTEMSSTFGDDGDSGSENPQEMARMMHKLFNMTGMQPSQAMQEAMRRMEAGEDPDRIDEEMGSILDEEEPMMGESGGIKARLKRYIEPPNVDPELYDL
jgi:putative FmdB family regulatory protein